MNSINVKGNLVADPEIVVTNSGKQVANVRIAINGTRKDTPPTYVNVKAWQGTADFVAKHFTKGAPIAISGEIRQDSWENKNGEKRSRLYILANRVDFAGGRQRQAA
jgi:single-strand DNA-binding protein